MIFSKIFQVKLNFKLEIVQLISTDFNTNISTNWLSLAIKEREFFLALKSEFHPRIFNPEKMHDFLLPFCDHFLTVL